MKFSAILGAALLLESVYAAVLPRMPHPQQPVPGVISAPIKRRNNIRSVERDLARRDAILAKRSNTVSLSLRNAQLLYFANITLGTPPQHVALQIDTGSSDIWVEVAGSQLCEERSNPCSQSQTYNSAASSTYKFVNSLFQIQYGDGSQAAGDYATETFNIGGAQITNMEFGVGTQSTSTEGVMGVGFASNEAILAYTNQSPYPNLVEQMVSQGFTQSQTYSLYLDDIEDSTGVILFGGVDTDKFSGTLSTFPINTDSSGIATQFVITLTGMSLTASGSSNGVGSSSLYPMGVLLDSGSSFMSLPTSLVESIASSLGAQYSNQLGGYVLSSCKQQFASGSLNFFFSGVEIQVPFDEFIINPTATNGQPFTYSNGELVCMLGIVPGTVDNIAVLGDTFLRSAYVVYDLDNQQISLAQTKFNQTASNILAIPSGKGQVPSATAVANPTTLVLGSNIVASNIPYGQNPTGTGGAIATAAATTEASSDHSSAASGHGIYGSLSGAVVAVSMTLCFAFGMFAL